VVVILVLLGDVRLVFVSAPARREEESNKTSSVVRRTAFLEQLHWSVVLLCA